MKKIILLIALLCLTLSIYAQNSVDDNKVLKELEDKIESFCVNIEKIGTTNAIPWDEKDKLREKVIPFLFVKYPERYMRTTGKNGIAKQPKIMTSYLYNLQQQSKKRPNTRVEYDLEFQLHGHASSFWTFYKDHGDGGKEYHSYAMIFQTYAIYTMNGVEVIRSYKEIDKKKMKIIKIVYPNGSTEVGLGDVTRVERLK